MPIRLPTLDDRTYDDLVAELRARIPAYAPEWTDHNPSDPGITLLELFAWLAEGLMYRIDQVPEASSVRMLKLLGAAFRPAQPATVLLRVSLLDDDLGPVIVPAGVIVEAASRLTGPSGEELRVTFETVGEARLTREWPEALVTARQLGRVTGEFLGRGTGAPRQSFRLAARQVVVDADPPSGNQAASAPGCSLQVLVDGQPWSYRPRLDGLSVDDPSFTVDVRRNLVRFGPGRQNRPRRWPPNGESAVEAANVEREGGKAPPPRGVIVASYCYTLGAAGNMSEECSYTLQEPFPGITLEAVGPATGGADATTLEDARAQVWDMINSPWRATTSQDFENLIRGPAKFGIARAKSLPEIDARGPGAAGTRSGAPSSEDVPTEGDSADGLTPGGEVRSEAGHVSLMVLPEPDSQPLVNMVAPTGNGPMTVQQTVFSQDGSALAVWAVAGDAPPLEPAAELGLRADCIWAWRLSADADEPAAAHVSAYHPPATPLPLPLDARVTTLALSPDGQWLAVGLRRSRGASSTETRGHSRRTDAENRVVLWDLRRLPYVETTDVDRAVVPAPVSAIIFRPDSRQAVILAGNLARRYDLAERQNRARWTFAGDLPHPVAVESAVYSPDGRLLATVAERSVVRLWGAAWAHIPASAGAPESVGQAELLAALRHDAPTRSTGVRTPALRTLAVRSLLFTPDGRWLVTLSQANTLLAWPTPRRSGGAGPLDLSIEPVAISDVPFAQVTGLALRQRGRRLAVAGTGGSGGKGKQGVAFFEIATGTREPTDSTAPARWLPAGSLLTELSPDLRRLLFVDDEDKFHAQVWDCDAGVRMGVLHHDEPVLSAFFSPDGEHLVTVAGPADDAPAPTSTGVATLAPAPPGAEIHVARAWNTSGAGLELTVYLTRPASLPRSAASRGAAAAEIAGALGPGGKLLATWWASVAAADSPYGQPPPVVQVWEAEKLGRASAFLDGRKLVTTHHHVLGSRFVDVQVRAAVVPTGQVDEAALRTDAAPLSEGMFPAEGTLAAAIHDALERFFSPFGDLAGNSEGWPYGRNIHISEVYKAIEDVPGVDHVASLTLLARDDAPPTSDEAAEKLPGWEDAGLEIFVLPNQLVHYVGHSAAGGGITIRRPGS